MGRTPRQKELLAAYRDHPVIGGVCAITNTATGCVLLIPGPSLDSQRNRFAFAVATNMPLMPSMAADWAAYGASAFSFRCLEQLEKKPDQTQK